jgi:hypothetical protein
MNFISGVLQTIPAFLCANFAILVNGQCFGDLRALVERAKQQGQNSISLRTPRGNPAVASSIEDVRDHEAALLVNISEKQTRLSENGKCIITWYRASIIAKMSAGADWADWKGSPPSFGRFA